MFSFQIFLSFQCMRAAIMPSTIFRSSISRNSSSLLLTPIVLEIRVLYPIHTKLPLSVSHNLKKTDDLHPAPVFLQFLFYYETDFSPVHLVYTLILQLLFQFSFVSADTYPFPFITLETVPTLRLLCALHLLYSPYLLFLFCYYFSQSHNSYCSYACPARCFDMHIPNSIAAGNLE